MPFPALEAGASIAAMFVGRNGLSAGDVKEVFFPKNSAVSREEKAGPVTDRIASIDLAFNRAFSYRNLKGLKFYLEYGGTDLSFANRVTPRLTDEAILTGLYLDTGTTSLRFEYSQNFENNDTVWYSHGQFSDGYTNRGDIMGHHIGGMAQDVYVSLTHPFGKRWAIIVDYENLSHKKKLGNPWGYSNDVSVGLDYSGDVWLVRAEYEYGQDKSPGRSDDHNLILLRCNVSL